MRKIAVLAMAFLFVLATVSFAGGGPQATTSKAQGSTSMASSSVQSAPANQSGNRPWEIFQAVADTITPTGHPATKPTKTLAQSAYDSLEQGFAVSGAGMGKDKPFQAAYNDVPTWDDTASQAKPQSIRGNKAMIMQRRGQLQRL